MQWGDKLESLLQAKARGMKVPALERRPKLLPSLEWYVREAFNTLQDDRDYNESRPKRWKLAEIVTYWRTFKLQGNFEDFHDKMRRIEHAWLEEVNKYLDAKQKAAEAKAKATKRTPKR